MCNCLTSLDESRLNWFDKGVRRFSDTRKNEYSDYGDVETPRRKNSADEFLCSSPLQILVSTEVGVRQKLWTLKDTKAFVSL
jgi:hypothetical protein